jgi:hypothetical protein
MQKVLELQRLKAPIENAVLATLSTVSNNC